MNSEAINILNQVKSGELSPEEGARRLQELESTAGAPVAAAYSTAAAFEGKAEGFDQPVVETGSGGQEDTHQNDESLPDLGWWKKGWLIPFWAGTAVLVLSALWMGSAYTSRNFFWFYCSWLPMLLGLIVLFLSWWSQQARWVHVRVKDAGGTRVAISLPLPLGLAGRLLRVFGRFIPNMDRPALENLPEILDSLAKEKGPTTVEVDEKDGSRVRVYIL
jgi:hypothetical protein